MHHRMRIATPFRTETSNKSSTSADNTNKYERSSMYDVLKYEYPGAFLHHKIKFLLQEMTSNQTFITQNPTVAS